MSARRTETGKRDTRPVMFVGPTLATSVRGRSLARAAFRLRRPVRRGDIDALVASQRRPGVVVVVDGVFQDTLAVGHAELREALARGWRVWGLSSMGAIRAREMAHLGMRGYGRVYELFAREGDFQDDEVALLHEPSAPYRPVSEPMVHLRVAVEHLVTRGIVGASEGDEIVRDLKARWYGERTVRRLAHLVKRVAGARATAVDGELGAFARFRSKTLDLERFIVARPDEKGRSHLDGREVRCGSSLERK